MGGVRDVVVIGGGVAGLSAARECARVGLSVTVLEAGTVLGGALASHEVAGLTLDSGAESFAVRRNAIGPRECFSRATGEVAEHDGQRDKFAHLSTRLRSGR